MIKTLVIYSTYSLEPDAMPLKMQNAPQPTALRYDATASHPVPKPNALNPNSMRPLLSRQFALHPPSPIKPLGLQPTPSLSTS
jgi:hypothetical protein